MPMGFTFGFSGEDISDNETCVNESQASDVPKDVAIEALTPQLHTLDDLLSTLVEVRLTFDNYVTPGGNIVYRRHLFDIKHQAMVEENDHPSQVHNILTGNSCEEVDVHKNVYEGGFKLWECSYDLVDKLNDSAKRGELLHFSSLLELGCGSALPSCFLLMSQFSLSGAAPLNLSKAVFADFNYEVLRLVTLPNILIHWASTLGREKLVSFMNPDIPLNNDELILTPALLDHFKSSLQERQMEISFISGSWGPNFVSIASQFSPDLILSSETIYSPESIPVFLETMIALMRDREKSLALVAAKQYYFGVGGSVREFLEVFHQARPAGIIVESVGENLGQLKRDIIKLSFSL